MTDDRKTGIALIAGSLGGLLTMAIHPVGSYGLTVEAAARLAWISGFAHSLAMFSSLLLFLGACGLSRHLAIAAHMTSDRSDPDRLAFGGLVTYGFACVAILLAAAVSGFIVPALLQRAAAAPPETATVHRIVIESIFQFNQAFARIFAVAASVAILMWSASILRNGGSGRGLALYGCISSPVLILLIAVGHLRLNVHGMLAVVLIQTPWFIAAGAHLLTGKREKRVAAVQDR